MGKSPLRQLRVPDDPYFPACARASSEGTSIGAVTRELLRRYAAGELDVDLERVGR